MDWNKTTTILITAFIILNIFLFGTSFNNIFSDEYNVTSDKEFVEKVEGILKEKNIVIKGELPDDTYMLPILETEYEIIHINTELLTRFLGPGIVPIEDVTVYNNNNNEVLEIKEGKKLCYKLREKTSGDVISESITEYINEFLKEKKIDTTGYSENYRYAFDDSILVVYTKKYDDFSIDNSYMNFYFDKDGIYEFEMQNISVVKELAEKIRTFSAIEALPRLLSFENIETKEIISVEMTYYSEEDDNWQLISGINSYPVWKVIFNDGTQKHLSSINSYNIK
jgi:regulatory protein YycI of two-component signal transduction system YycFG